MSYSQLKGHMTSQTWSSYNTFYKRHNCKIFENSNCWLLNVCQGPRFQWSHGYLTVHSFGTLYKQRPGTRATLQRGLLPQSRPATIHGWDAEKNPVLLMVAFLSSSLCGDRTRNINISISVGGMSLCHVDLYFLTIHTIEYQSNLDL